MRYVMALFLLSVLSLSSCGGDGGACYSVPDPGQCRLWRVVPDSPIYLGACCSHDCECWEADYSEHDGELTIYGEPQPGCASVPGELQCDEACECEQQRLPHITTPFVDFYVQP